MSRNWLEDLGWVYFDIRNNRKRTEQSKSFWMLLLRSCKIFGGDNLKMLIFFFLKMLILTEVRAVDREVCFGIMKNFYLDVLCLRYIFDDQVEMFSKQQDLGVQRRVEVRIWRSKLGHHQIKDDI